MEDLAQWTDWPVVGGAVGLMVLAAFGVFLVVVVHDRWTHRRPEPAGPCCFGRHDDGDDQDDLEPSAGGDVMDMARAVGVVTPTAEEPEELYGLEPVLPRHEWPPVVRGYEDRRDGWDRLDRYGKRAA